MCDFLKMLGGIRRQSLHMQPAGSGSRVPPHRLGWLAQYISLLRSAALLNGLGMQPELANGKRVYH